MALLNRLDNQEVPQRALTALDLTWIIASSLPLHPRPRPNPTPGSYASLRSSRNANRLADGSN